MPCLGELAIGQRFRYLSDTYSWRGVCEVVGEVIPPSDGKPVHIPKGCATLIVEDHALGPGLIGMYSRLVRWMSAYYKGEIAGPCYQDADAKVKTTDEPLGLHQQSGAPDGND